MTTPQQERSVQRRVWGWGLFILAAPLIFILIMVNVQANAEDIKKHETDECCATVSHDSPEAVYSANRECVKSVNR